MDVDGEEGEGEDEEDDEVEEEGTEVGVAWPPTKFPVGELMELPTAMSG